jgi:amino acid adenylation domain-containing protein
MKEAPLHAPSREAARSRPDHPAVEEPGGARIDYRGLDRLSDRLRDRLARLGVARGDRVGVWIPKSIDAVASLLGVLKSGAAYVPVDPTAPAARNAYILRDCEVAALLVEERFAPALRAELGAFAEKTRWLVLPGAGGGAGLAAALERADAELHAPAVPSADSAPEDLAYILYTSGSTGRPKGVMISHRAATAFVRWCVDTFAPRPEDRFSSHAPFHFDLSIFDLYVPQTCGATVVLVTEELSRQPAALAELIERARISVWYSAPSILALLAQHGSLPRRDTANLRLVLFAGEVFPLVHLRALHAQLPRPRYFNLYGPTETNVCTSYELPARLPDGRVEPFPIGRVCAHYESLVVDPDGKEVARGAEGELCIAGPGVMDGYWNLPEQTERAFLDAGERRFYRTGDLVVEECGGDFRYLGRRDRMVKRRGYRVELGEIEARLYLHPGVAEAAVIALADPEAGVRLEAHVALREGAKLSLIAMKLFCAEQLPAYMVPDVLRVHGTLPKTSTDKVDYQKLRERA